ncbi:hypothetical protein I3843_09G024600 [Carya illinoinensis]|nr:hypothetical protein I3843_09G024600 [Carya illinoinensis]KAG7961595.1 hypothetical protein I3843_09G024600 [Carya illinoinensis]KAG7961596.1 hypothetical protein I3843_09G024600 [Carya illinoinensis]
MDLEASSSRDLVKCCNCGCSCSLISSSSRDWLRSVKRKHDEFEDGDRFSIPGFDFFSNARVQIENECALLREMVSKQQETIQDLHTELEEERNASSSAANEAMSMILRLQREKAEIQMEARQFKRFAEEKMAHDQQELVAMEDLLYKREQAIQSFTCEVQAYKHRLMSYGFTEAEVEGERGGHSHNPSMLEFDAQLELPMYEYPPLKCNLNETQAPLEEDNDVEDVDKYAFGETPRAKDRLKNLENRIYQMERSPSNSRLDGDSSGSKSILEKVVVGYSPRLSRHSRKFSNDFSAEYLRPISSFNKSEDVSQIEDYSNLRKLDNASEIADDNMSDRVYTIDSIHNGAPNNGFTDPKAGGEFSEDYVTTPMSLNQADCADPDIKKLYMRLQALEADRESMRQAIIYMRTDKAQMVLLKEIAQHLCNEMTPERRMTAKKPSLLGSFSFSSVFKWIVSFVFWKKRARRSKYMGRLSSSGVGLLMLLDKAPRVRPWRCLTSTQV